MKRVIVFLISALLIAGLIGWRITQKRAEASDQATQRAARGKAAVNVDVATAEEKTVVRSFEAVGSVESPLSVDVTPKVSGRITFLQVQEGDRVQAGQVLAQIDPAEIDAQVRQKEATVAQAQARLAEAQVTQGSQNVTVETDILKQKSVLGSAQAQARLAKADYDQQIAVALASVADADARLESATANVAATEATIKTAEANLANGRVQFERQETLYKQGATSKEVRDNAETTVKVQEATLGEAQQRRDAAVSARNSVVAQKRAAEKQVNLARSKATLDLLAARSNTKQQAAALAATQASRSRTPAFRQNLQALQAAVNATQADLRVTQAQRGDTVLRSPIAGVVSRREVDPGALATPTQPVVRVQAIQTVWVTIGVPEETNRRLRTGQMAQVSFDALPEVPFTGRIVQINPAADPQSRQFTVRIRLDNRQNRLRPGMFARVTLELQKEKGIVVPLEAAKRENPASNKAQVTVVGQSDTAQTRNVLLGLADANRVVVRNGLQAGESVVILAGRDIKDGTAVRVSKAVGGDKPDASKGSGETAKTSTDKNTVNGERAAEQKETK